MLTHRRIGRGWIFAIGPVCLAVAAACSSGSSDVPDSGTPDASSGSGGGTSSSGGSTSSSSSSSSSGGPREAGGGVPDAGLTILFPFNKPSDVPPLCPNNTQGCWFWDNYNPACDVGAAPALEAGPAEAGAPEGGFADGSSDGVAPAADAGDGAVACPYPLVAPIISYDDKVGDDPGNSGGDPGSMQVVVPFTGYNQQSLLQWIFSATSLPPLTGPYLDLNNKTLFVRIRFDSGGNPNPMSNPNAFQLAVKTTMGYVYYATPYANLSAPGAMGFVEFDLPLPPPPGSAPVGFDATQVIAIELHFDAGGGPGAGVDAGGLPTTATFHIDTIGAF